MCDYFWGKYTFFFDVMDVFGIKKQKMGFKILFFTKKLYLCRK